MRKGPGILFISLLAAGYAVSGRTAAPPERLDAAKENQQILELRITRIEERLAHLESMLGEIRRDRVSDARPSGAAAAVAAKTARKSAAEAAPPQELGTVSLEYPAPAASPRLTLSKAKGTNFPQNPLALGLEYSAAALAAAPATGAIPFSGNAGPAPQASPAPVLAPPAALAPGPASRASSVPGPAPFSGAPGNGPGLAPPVAVTPGPAPEAADSARPQAGGKKAYDAALALYYKGEHIKAEEAFQSFLRSSPGSALAPNAMYWQGECLYSLGRYDQAILVFKDVVTRYPGHDKAAAALLKAGYSYERMKDMDNARFYWQLLLDDFPRSAPAALARKRLGAG